VLNDANGTKTLTVAQVIERISRDLETGGEDAAYGVGAVTEPPDASGDGTGKKIMIGALGGIAAALGKQGLGL
jgi:hypothetical protein